MNLVWNWANETSAKASRPFVGKSKWLTGFDLNKLSSGATGCFEYIGADTIQLVNQEYATRRRQFKRPGNEVYGERIPQQVDHQIAAVHCQKPELARAYRRCM